MCLTMEHRQLHEGTDLSENLIKHSSAPIYPPAIKHPHADYSNLPRLKIKAYDEQLKKMKYKFDVQCKFNPDLSKQHNFLDFVDISKIHCPCKNKILFEKILNPDDNNITAMAYSSCKHTILAAAKRQMKMAPTPEPKIADEFVEYCKKIIDKEVGDELKHFGYSYQDWYHHLNKAKQNDMDLYCQYRQAPQTLTYAQRKIVSRKYYEGICKVELQELDGKPRMVCAIPLETKFIMGPVCWHLEEIFDDKLNGYCGAKNLQQMADKLNNYIALGFTKIVSGDGSSFDNTQDITLKRVDQYIYEQVLHAVHHCDKNEFYSKSHENYKEMVISYVHPDSKKKIELLKYKILGTVFSGDCDTTLCNTIRMALYNRFVNDKAGLIYGQDYVVLSKGDDFTVLYKNYVSDYFINKAYYRYFLPAVKDITHPDTRIYGLGQVLKMLKFGLPNSFIFCSLRSWYLNPTGEQVYLTRDPKKFYTLSCYSRKTKSYNLAQRIAYMYDQAESLRVNYPGLQIFETAAQAYINQANKLLRTAPNRKKLLQKLDKIRFADKKKLMKYLTSQDRKPKSDKMPDEDKNYYNWWYEVNHKKIQIKIQEDYWNTMKLIEKRQTTALTMLQKQYINEQINQEFDVEELKTILGLKISNEHN